MQRVVSLFSIKDIGRAKLGAYLVFSLLFSLTFPFAQWTHRISLGLHHFIPEVPFYTACAFLLLLVFDNLSRKASITVPERPVAKRQKGDGATSSASQPDQAKRQLFSRCLSRLKTSLTPDRKMQLLLFAVLAVVYFLNFLLYYPGCGTTDSDSAISQALGYSPYTRLTSPFHTFVISIILRIGLIFTDLEGALALFSTVQLLATAAVLSYFLCWIKRKGVPSWVFVLCLLFFALNPVVARFAITMWKDIPFSLSVLLLMTLLFDVAQSQGALLRNNRSMLIKLLIICFCILFFRKNGLIIVAGVAVFLLFWLKAKEKLPAISLLVLLAASAIIQGPVLTAAGMEPDSFVETSALPIQQLTNLVYRGEALSEEQMALMNNIIPEDKLREVYGYHSPDPMKFSGWFDYDYLDAHKTEFMLTWLELMPSYPKEYLQAWGSLSRGYWYIGEAKWIVSPAGFARQGSTNILLEHTGFTWASVGLDTQYEDIRNYPLIYPLFNLGCLVWMTLASALLCFNKNSRWKLVCLLPVLLLVFTMLFGAPATELRYIFAIHLSLPLLLLLPFLRRQAQPSMKPALP
ncbi:MAG: DUF6020 family protein [Coriobacteriales bacterium]|jgi:hypothetical protein|nr:DUF6020 family protein [Coriobacteriales bacterium]